MHGYLLLAYVIPVFSLASHDFSIFCSTCSKSTKCMEPNGNSSTEQDKVLSFVEEKELFCTEVKLFY